MMKKFEALKTVLSMWMLLNGIVSSQKPKVVNLGAIFSSDTVIGRAARPAIEAAVSDVNNDPRVLNGTELRLLVENVHCNVFLGSMGAFQVIGREVVAILGPQSSSTAHFISEIANGLQVPLVSYAVTDPTLSALQFPFFVRTTQSDSHQMAAMADLIDLFGWNEVIAIYVDDDYGRNGIAALDDEFCKRMAKLPYKLPLPVQSGENEITDILNKCKLLSTRVYVVHVNPDPSLKIFTIAKKLGMMTDNFVWLATDWLSATIDSFSPVNRTLCKIIQGVVGLRQHTPESSQKRAFMSRWRAMQKVGSASSELNTYGLQAYDTVWTVAYAIDRFIREFHNISFSANENLLKAKASGLQLGNLKIFNNGTYLLNQILQTNFTGLSGRILFNQARDLEGGGYDVINIDHKSIETVGYWSNNSGCSLLPPELRRGEQDRYSRINQDLKKITWPGGKTERPLGWVVAVNERPLRIGVPYRASFVDFVTVNSSHQVRGYCIDIFLEARKLVPYDIPYRFEAIGDGHSNPSYDELADMVAANVLDAAVGDIAIVTDRTKKVDFSQPYSSSGLVVVAPIKSAKSSAWVFLKPFTSKMWAVTAGSFVMIAVVIWILEHRVNDDFRGSPKRQLITMFMFSFSTLFKKNKEDTISPLGRMVMVVWLFLLMVIISSYTASLSSILTVQQLSSPITGIDSLVASNWPIGYQVGSFAYGYLSENLYVRQSRLVPLGTPEAYAEALRKGPSNGGVAAIVDELPYVELFLTNQTEFGIVGSAFTRGGWGFAFQRDSPLAVGISTAILKLSETGKLQRIHDRWFCKNGCPDEKIRDGEPNQLQMTSFWGLYLLCGGFALAALLLFMLRMVRQFVRYKYSQMRSSSSPTSSSTSCSQVVRHFVDFIDEKDEAVKRMFSHSEISPPRPSLGISL